MEIASNGGTLGGTGVVGTVTIQSGGTLAPGPSVGTFTISSNLNIGGNLAIEVNKSLAQSNDFVVVTGGLTNTGTGTLTVSNLGPALAVGDKFTLFGKPVQNGALLNVVGAGVNWVNNLAVDDGVTPWSGQVSHGEMVREGNDERMILDPDNLMFFYQGIADADNRGDYGRLPYKLGLLRAVKNE